jgi:hypothetical protein
MTTGKVRRAGWVIGGIVATGLAIAGLHRYLNPPSSERVENPVLIQNQDATTLYSGANKDDRSRNLRKVGAFTDLSIVRDLDNSAQPYAEIKQPAEQATVHIGRDQPVPTYEALGNGGCFDR